MTKAGAAVQIGFFIPGQIKGQDVIVVSVLIQTRRVL